ncbi:hypothetical protein [Pseudomonas sp. LS-2]|uniref:hypothetical protein n=1 Tax=Pseudomonas sp. LS-2 TaxID=2315859 RepID=UPI000E744F09|nr:hypothetical protein [Pseudomonas sp. LS-2]RJX83476.1 hypothetical protein D3M70_00165 [Pseudomonas sp. LS-2]
MMMKRLTVYLGLALAACLSCFSLTALADPVTSALHAVRSMGETQSVAFKRLELTLVAWRTGSQPTDEALKSNLRASSNHFEMASAKPKPERDGPSIC